MDEVGKWVEDTIDSPLSLNTVSFFFLTLLFLEFLLRVKNPSIDRSKSRFMNVLCSLFSFPHRVIIVHRRLPIDFVDVTASERIRTGRRPARPGVRRVLRNLLSRILDSRSSFAYGVQTYNDLLISRGQRHYRELPKSELAH